jgi:hypothetical protein
MGLYRAIALVLAIAFVAVGAVFLVAPGSVGALFAFGARLVEIPDLPVGGIETGLFRVLACAYMYVVAGLAWMMYRRPAEAVWPTVLAHAKLASATLSFALCVVQGPTLVLAANAVVDGMLGVLALWLRRQAIAGRGRSDT